MSVRQWQRGRALLDLDEWIEHARVNARNALEAAPLLKAGYFETAPVPREFTDVHDYLQDAPDLRIKAAQRSAQARRSNASPAAVAARAELQARDNAWRRIRP